MELSVKQRLHLETILSTFSEGKYEQLKAKKSALEKITFDSKIECDNYKRRGKDKSV